MQRNLKFEAEQIFRAGIRAVDPQKVITAVAALVGNTLRLGEERVDLDRFSRTLVAGAGKASARMAQALEEILGDRVEEGVVVVKYGHGTPLRKIQLLEAGHPIPDERGLHAARELFQLAKGLGRVDLLLFLLSGGASALVPLPVPGVTLAEKVATTDLLLKSGASIREINVIRKHLSQIKGGQLARLVSPGTLICLVLSDVVGDPLDVIGSGPTVGDPSSFGDCLEVLNRHGLAEKVPAAVRSYLEAGAAGRNPETPKPGDPIFERTSTLLVGSNLQALEAAAAAAEGLGYNCLILSSLIEGDSREAARFHTALAREIIKSGHPLAPPACLISGGETTVVVRGKGKGGRNQEFALAAALELDGLRGVGLLAAGTDGTDGPTEAAGALVDGDTVARARARGLEPRKFLEENDSYHFFHQLGDLLITGPTYTNVMDLRVILVSDRTELA